MEQFQHENITKFAKSKKAEKSQEELRKFLGERFLRVKMITKENLQEYEKSLQEELFLDKDGEEEGSGEKRREALQSKINGLLDRAEQMKSRLDNKEELSNYTESISTEYIHPNSKIENITFSIEKKIEEFTLFYKQNNINLPPDFEDQIKEIWQNNIEEIEKAIQENGFDEILLIPGEIPLGELNTKMTEGYKNTTYESDNFKEGGSFAGAKSQNVDKPRIVLVHKTQNLKDRPELEKTLNIKGIDVKMDETLTLEDYFILQRKYFEETGKHLDEDGWTWLATKSGARLVFARWYPVDGQFYVAADDFGSQGGRLGARPSRSFY